jgi:hypothetical protein
LQRPFSFLASKLPSYKEDHLLKKYLAIEIAVNSGTKKAPFGAFSL